MTNVDTKPDTAPEPTKYSGGTWQKAASYTRDQVLVGVQTPAGWHQIATVATPDGSPQGHANVDLIITAPELLTALKDASTWFSALKEWERTLPGYPNWESGYHPGANLDAMIEQTRAAIAKAEGGAR